MGTAGSATVTGVRRHTRARRVFALRGAAVVVLAAACGDDGAADQGMEAASSADAGAVLPDARTASPPTSVGSPWACTAIGAVDDAGAEPPGEAPCEAGVAQVVAGQFHTCARSCAGTVKCWGGNDEGQLGLGDREARGDQPSEMGDALPTVDLGTGRVAVQLAAGHRHTCAVLDDASLKCWGENSAGELGQGDRHDRGDGPGELGDALAPIDVGAGRAVVGVAAGGSHTCALLDDGSVKCWGENLSGELGQGDTEARGDAPGEMGDALPSIALGATALSLTAGADHSCALLEGGAVKCWGENVSGQLGQADDEARGDAPGELGEALAPTDLGTGCVADAVSTGGGRHNCALLGGGRVKCWGDNATGNLGIGDAFERGRLPHQLGDHLAPVDLGAAPAIQVSAGGSHSCALLSGGAVKCWGYNGYAALGQGDVENRGDAEEELGEALSPVDLGADVRATAVVAGPGNHSCALLAAGAVKCWGSSGQGQLGQGDGDTRGDAPGELGDALPAVDLGSSHTAP